MKDYKYVLLDWDGNLAKTLDIWLEASRAVLEKHGINLTDEEIAGSFGAFTAQWKAWGIADVEAAINEADLLAQKCLPDVGLYPDVLEVLEKLHKKGKRLALLTTSSHTNIQHPLEKYDMHRLFGAVIAGDDVRHFKPHPESIEKSLKALGGDTDRAIMIGDSDKDISAAHNAGIDSILFYPEEHRKYYSLEQLKQLKPTYVASSFRQILSLLG